MTNFKVPQNHKVINYLMSCAAGDLSEAAAKISGEISKGRYEEEGDLSLQVALVTLMDQVVGMWNLSKMTDQDHENQSQSEYERSCLRIPRLQNGYELADLE